MEKVWNELKKVEAQANQIQSEAQEKAKEIITLSQKQSELLIANSKTYGEEEAQQFYKSAIDQANRTRDEQLKANQETIEKLRVNAEKRMADAAILIANKVLGETKL